MLDPQPPKHRQRLAHVAQGLHGGALELDYYTDLTVTSSLIVDNFCDEDGAAAEFITAEELNPGEHEIRVKLDAVLAPKA